MNKKAYIKGFIKESLNKGELLFTTNKLMPHSIRRIVSQFTTENPGMRYWSSLFRNPHILRQTRAISAGKQTKFDPEILRQTLFNLFGK